jgi:GH25 family lysozyme M1 (1,4-beta-N-acetylmuramidase)
VAGQVALAASHPTAALAVPAAAALPAAPAATAVASTATAAAGSATQRGVDVASHQHPGGAPIDWPAVAAWGVDFAYIKATEGPVNGGNTYVNPYFAADWRGAGAAGILRGAYHYARPRLPVSTAVHDAQKFLLTTGPFGGPADLPPVLDLEETGGLRGADLVAWADAWMGEITRQTGRWPMLYSAPWYLDGSVGGAAALADHPMWIADYSGSSYPRRLPAGWSRWTIWQFTPSARIPGIPAPVDLNAACDLRAYVQNPC